MSGEVSAMTNNAVNVLVEVEWRLDGSNACGWGKEQLQKRVNVRLMISDFNTNVMSSVFSYYHSLSKTTNKQRRSINTKQKIEKD